MISISAITLSQFCIIFLTGIGFINYSNPLFCCYPASCGFGIICYCIVSTHDLVYTCVKRFSSSYFSGMYNTFWPVTKNSMPCKRPPHSCQMMHIYLLNEQPFKRKAIVSSTLFEQEAYLKMIYSLFFEQGKISLCFCLSVSLRLFLSLSLSISIYFLTLAVRSR